MAAMAGVVNDRQTHTHKHSLNMAACCALASDESNINLVSSFKLFLSNIREHCGCCLTSASEQASHLQGISDMNEDEDDDDDEEDGDPT